MSAGRKIEHEARGAHLCSCGARFKSKADLRNHVRLFATEQVGIGFAPHARDFHQKKQPRV